MEVRESERGIEIATPCYRLLLERAGGFAIREVEVHGQGRLDRFDRPGEGPHPTCMYFDNLTINYAFQLAYYGKTNSGVKATVDGDRVRLQGRLIPIVDDAPGYVRVEKYMRFEDELYDADLHLQFAGTGSASI